MCPRSSRNVGKKSTHRPSQGWECGREHRRVAHLFMIKTAFRCSILFFCHNTPRMNQTCECLRYVRLEFADSPTPSYSKLISKARDLRRATPRSFMRSVQVCTRAQCNACASPPTHPQKKLFGDELPAAHVHHALQRLSAPTISGASDVDYPY